MQSGTTLSLTHVFEELTSRARCGIYTCELAFLNKRAALQKRLSDGFMGGRFADLRFNVFFEAFIVTHVLFHVKDSNSQNAKATFSVVEITRVEYGLVVTARSGIRKVEMPLQRGCFFEDNLKFRCVEGELFSHFACSCVWLLKGKLL